MYADTLYPTHALAGPAGLSGLTPEPDDASTSAPGGARARLVALSEMARLAPTPLLVIDAHSGAILIANPLAAALLHLPAENLGLIYTLFDNANLGRQLMLIVRHSRPLRCFEARIRQASGALVWVLLSARLVQLENSWPAVQGEPINPAAGISEPGTRADVGTTADAGTRTCLLMTMEETQDWRQDLHDRRFDGQTRRRVMAASRQGYALLDPRTDRLVEANPALCALLGYREDDLRTHPLRQFLVRESWSVLRTHRRDWDTLTQRRVAICLRHASGRRVDVEATLLATHAPEGTLEGIFILIEDLSRHQADRHRHPLLHHDTLTTLPGTLLAIEHLTRALQRGHRNGDWQGVLLIDLDDFRLINRRWGYALADRVLQTTAHRIYRSVRTADLVARLDGDRFLILFGQVRGADDFPALIERLRARLAQAIPLDPAQPEHSAQCITASLGLSYCLAGRENTETLLQQAQNALRTAKQAGKDRFVIHPHTPSTADAARSSPTTAG